MRSVEPSALPIETIVPEIVAALAAGSNLVVQAEPGAGKTTRVPVVLLEHGLAEPGEIVVAQPRRLAARMAASFVARSLSEPLGRRCGYQVRFETVASAATQIRFVTEGVLMRRLEADPALRGVGTVVLDEFHERHVDGDVALALARRLQRDARPDLRIVVMSATLDADPVARWLDATALSCPGRTHEVHIEHATKSSDRPVAAQVVNALRDAVAGGLDGSVLVFLPGAREIRQTSEALASFARQHDLEVVPLHGDLPAAQQDRAVSPGPRPKVILSTNVAETSITIEDVTVVIDSGLVRRPSHDPWSGIPTLTLAKASQASATQRAGRAGRTRPGRCIRLYTANDLARRPAHDEPEIARLDLANACLSLRAAGLDAPGRLEWFQAPPDASVEAAEALLRRLDAIDDAGRLTEAGRAMLRFPAHPRIGRLLVEAQRREIPRLGARAAALLSERSIHRRTPHAASPGGAPPLQHARNDVAAATDVTADLAALDEAAAGRPHPGLDRGACRRVDRVCKQLLRLVGNTDDTAADPEEALCLALLVAFADRVGRARPDHRDEQTIVLAGGGQAVLDPASVVHGADFVVALAVEQRREGTRGIRNVIRSAAHIEPEWLLELFPDRVEEAVRVELDADRERVEAVLQLRYEDLIIDATPCRELPPEATAVLREAALSRGPAAFVADADALEQLSARSAYAHARHPEVPVVDDARLRDVLASMCEGRRSFAELRKADLVAHVRATLPPNAAAALERLAPTHVTLAGGRRLRVHYAADRAPWVSSRLQDFFGTTQGPRVGDEPAVLHLLAPNQRAVQVTTDLEGFWQRHYPELRRQLMRRYPKHAWPEDPRTARPPPPPGRHRRRR